MIKNYKKKRAGMRKSTNQSQQKQRDAMSYSEKIRCIQYHVLVTCSTCIYTNSSPRPCFLKRKERTRAKKERENREKKLRGKDCGIFSHGTFLSRKEERKFYNFISQRLKKTLKSK